MNHYVMLLLFAVILAGCSAHSAYEFQSSNVQVTNSFKDYESSVALEDREPAAEPNDVLTLRDAVRLTLLHNPELMAYSYDIRAAEARHLQAGLWQNPKLEIEVENLGGSGDFSGFNSAETTVQLSQIIELGDKIGKRKRAVAYDSQLAESEYNAKRLDISNELTKSFIRLLFIQEKQALSEELIHISKEIAESVQKRFEAGKVSSIDLSKAKIGFAQAKLQQLEITKYHDVTRVQLASYWNSQQPTFTTAAGRLDELSGLPDFKELQVHLQNNPDIIQSAIAVQKRKAEMALADAGGVPDVKIAGGVKHFNDLDDIAFVFGLSIPLSVSDRNQGRRMEAAQHYRKAQEMQKVSVLSVWNEVNRLYAQLQTAYTTATILRDEVMAPSEQMFNATKVSYEQGKKNYLDLLDSQRMYFTSKNDYIDALANYHIAKTDLERLIGQSLQDIHITEK